MHLKNACTWCGGLEFWDDRCWRCGEPDRRADFYNRRDSSTYDYAQELPRVLNPWKGILVPPRVSSPPEGAWCERCALESDPEHGWHAPPPSPPTWQDSRTLYHWVGKGPYLNMPVLLCAEHAQEHHHYWDEMWSNVSYP